jgi:hypothetical protein
MTLTRKADVLTVLQAGGHIRVDAPDKHPRLVHLFDREGAPVDAWQTAISSCLFKCVPVNGAPMRWELAQ